MAAGSCAQITLYERPGCHLCEQAAAELEPLAERLGARLARVNIETDPALEARLGLTIPVVMVNDAEVTSAPIDLAAVVSAVTHATAARGQSGRDER